MNPRGAHLIKAFQHYRRLTRLPRTGATRRLWLHGHDLALASARENRRSALGLLREGIAHIPQYEQILSQLAATDGWLPVKAMLRPGQSHASLGMGLRDLLTILARFEVEWIARETRLQESPKSGIEHWYRLTPEGRAVMACQIHHEEGKV